MIKYPDLARIQSGRATTAEARAALRHWLASGDVEASEHVYVALRGWTWKALTQRRMDDALGEWLKLMRSAVAAAAKSAPELASRIDVLADFVNESIRFAATHTDEGLLNREHLGDILECLRQSNGPTPRKVIAQTVKVHDTYLSQLLTELCALGKIEREQRSREARFSLTDAGRALAQKHALRQAPQVDFAATPAIVQHRPHADVGIAAGRVREHWAKLLANKQGYRPPTEPAKVVEESAAPAPVKYRTIADLIADGSTYTERDFVRVVVEHDEEQLLAPKTSWHAGTSVVLREPRAAAHDSAVRRFGAWEKDYDDRYA